jgi:hypothetical protein
VNLVRADRTHLPYEFSVDGFGIEAVPGARHSVYNDPDKSRTPPNTSEHHLWPLSVAR